MSTETRISGPVNELQGHLRIDSAEGCWLFIDTGTTTISFGPDGGPSIELDASNLLQLRDYCQRMAAKLVTRESRQ